MKQRKSFFDQLTTSNSRDFSTLCSAHLFAIGRRRKSDFFKDCFRNMICDILIVKFSKHLIPMTFYLKLEKHFLQPRSIFFSPLFFPFKQLKIFSIFRTKENICASISFLIKLQNEYPELCFTEGLTQVFLREFWEIFKNIYLRTVVASSFLINI